MMHKPRPTIWETPIPAKTADATEKEANVTKKEANATKKEANATKKEANATKKRQTQCVRRFCISGNMPPIT